MKRLTPPQVARLCDLICTQYRDSGLDDIQFGQRAAQEVGVDRIPGPTVRRLREHLNVPNNLRVIASERRAAREQADAKRAIDPGFDASIRRLEDESKRLREIVDRLMDAFRSRLPGVL